MTRRRTYWHLEGAGRKPSEYDIATSRLLYAPQLGYAVENPVTEWQRRYVDGSRLRCRDWDRFRDPRETTYASYVARQQRREIFIDGLLDEETGPLAEGWLRALERVLPVLRFPLHALQMVAAYAGSLAPGGRLVVVLAFQAADEMRRVQRLAYRMRQLQDVSPGFGAGARGLWEDDPAWQPWRAVIERLLVVRDLGETLAALNLAVKPAFEELFLGRLADAARAAGDDVLHRLLGSLREDGAWHAEWTAALAQMLVADDPGNEAVLAELAAPWRQAAHEAVTASAPLLHGGQRAA